jgi:hypothetical protein
LASSVKTLINQGLDVSFKKGISPAICDLALALFSGWKVRVIPF